MAIWITRLYECALFLNTVAFVDAVCQEVPTVFDFCLFTDGYPAISRLYQSIYILWHIYKNDQSLYTKNLDISISGIYFSVKDFSIFISNQFF